MKFKAYFQDELNYLKDAGDEFSRLNPRLEKYLSSSSSDPDMEKLIEGFAFLTSRLRQTLDDELSDLTQSVLRMLWPGFLAPIPPLAMLKFSPIDRAITGHHQIKAGMPVSSRPIDDVTYSFVTTSDCDLYPLELTGTRLERSGDRSVLTLSFSTLSGLPLSDIGLDRLRLWLTGETQSSDILYLWTRCYLRAARVVSGGRDDFSLPPDTVHAGGFDISEALLPGALPAFDGYRLLQEYFAFPDKFRCLDLLNLGPHFSRLNGTEFNIEFHYSRPMPPDVQVDDSGIRLYCTPIVNLSSEQAEPFLIREGEMSHLVKPISREGRQFEVFSVDNVSVWHGDSKRKGAESERSFMRYESFEHMIEHAEHRENVYFREYVTPRQAGLGLDTFLSFVRHDGIVAKPDGRHIGARLTCFQPDAPVKVGIGSVSIPTQHAPSFTTFTNFTVPTRPMYPRFEEGEHWDLISNLSQNVVDLTDRDVLSEILRVYDYPYMNDRQAEHATKKRLKGIVGLTTKPVDRLFRGRPVRGVTSTMELKDSAFSSVGEMYLFAGIIAEFLSIYATQNSFHQLQVRSAETGEVYSWPAKRGRQPLI